MAASRVASSAASQQDTDPSGTLACPVSVTAGNSLIISITSYRDAGSPTLPTISKSSGTATIGTPITDGSSISSIDSKLRIDIIRVPITGSGSLTIGYTSSNTLSTIGFAEYAGLDADAIVDGTPVTNNATGTTYTTGNITTTATAGLIIAGYADLTSPAYTLTSYSDAEIWQQTNTAIVTGTAQDKVTTSAGTVALTVLSSVSQGYTAVAVAYKAAGGGGSTVGRLVGGTLLGGVLVGGLLSGR